MPSNTDSGRPTVYGAGSDRDHVEVDNPSEQEILLENMNDLLKRKVKSGDVTPISVSIYEFTQLIELAQEAEDWRALYYRMEKEHSQLKLNLRK